MEEKTKGSTATDFANKKKRQETKENKRPGSSCNRGCLVTKESHPESKKTGTGRKT